MEERVQNLKQLRKNQTSNRTCLLSSDTAVVLRTLQKKLPSNTSGPRSNLASTPNHPRFSDVLEIDSTLQPNSYPDASDDENLSDSASRDGNGISPDFGSENDEAFDEGDARDTRDFRGRESQSPNGFERSTSDFAGYCARKALLQRDPSAQLGMSYPQRIVRQPMPPHRQ